MSLHRVAWSATLILLAACSKPPPAAAPPRAVRVTTTTLRPVARTARYSGVLEPKTQLDLAFRVPGRVASVGLVSGPGQAPRPLQEGDEVRAGQVLATLDLEDLRHQRSAAAAGAASTAAQVSSARTALAQSEREVTRARTLFGHGDFAQAELDRAEAAFSAAGSALSSIEAQHQSRLDQLSLSQSTFADATLRSPIDGVLARRSVDPGELVPPNLPVFTVVDLSELRVVFGVPDTRVTLVRLGAKVPVIVEALPGRPLIATVSKVAPTADPTLRTWAVELRLAGAVDLRAGMTATALLGGEEGGEATVLPLSAVVKNPSGEGYVVFTVSADSMARALPVEVADLLENDVVMGGGLDAGVRVVVDGAQFLRDGERVGVVP
jgi:RND family efflux transporter MFP subunit